MRFQNGRRLRIGGSTKDELLRQLAQHSISLNDYARDLFADADFITSCATREVRLAIVSLPEIGLPDGGRFDDILARAATLGLEPCPLEVGPRLRLDYLDQIDGPYLTVVSLELHPGSESPNGFYLRRLEGSLWLRGYESGPENVYASDFSEFVFLDPVNQSQR